MSSLCSFTEELKAMRCRFHDGRPTGPKTAEGRARISVVHTVHGRESRAKRAVGSAKLAELQEIEKGLHPYTYYSGR